MKPIGLLPLQILVIRYPPFFLLISFHNQNLVNLFFLLCHLVRLEHQAREPWSWVTNM
jgi:hypothetical protein